MVITAEKVADILQLLLKGVAKVERRPNKIGSCGGDTEKTWAFDIDFHSWQKQNHKSPTGAILYNCDYWMPKIRANLSVSESYWHNSYCATIWIYKDQKKLNLNQ